MEGDQILVLTVLMFITSGEFNIVNYMTQAQPYAGCECSCDYPNFTASNAAESKHRAQVDAQKIERDLAVDTTKLSIEHWKKASAPDNRPTAKGIGCVGVVTLVCVCLVIVISDLPRFAKMLSFSWKAVFKLKHS
ncbi:DSCAM [Biomphalaria pfeifferi]|uniref:DSCAM n=1 Tax=Biomphalaria pfeifferi TaxID=112525 RepID=A0AAD8BUB3_BIOPF|nr:DSCAM [Biomphalaria pfeifferi]